MPSLTTDFVNNNNNANSNGHKLTKSSQLNEFRPHRNLQNKLIKLDNFRICNERFRFKLKCVYDGRVSLSCSIVGNEEKI